MHIDVYCCHHVRRKRHHHILLSLSSLSYTVLNIYCCHCHCHILLSSSLISSSYFLFSSSYTVVSVIIIVIYCCHCHHRRILLSLAVGYIRAMLLYKFHPQIKLQFCPQKVTKSLQWKIVWLLLQISE